MQMTLNLDSEARQALAVLALDMPSEARIKTRHKIAAPVCETERLLCCEFNGLTVYR